MQYIVLKFIEIYLLRIFLQYILGTCIIAICRTVAIPHNSVLMHCVITLQIL